MLEDENGVGQKTPLNIGMNDIFWHGKNRVFDVREIPTIFSGLCHVILPHNVSSDPGDSFTFEFFSNVTLEEDQLTEIKIQFSSKGRQNEIRTENRCFLSFYIKVLDFKLC